MKKEYKINSKIYPIEVISQGITDFSDISVITFDDNILVIEGENTEEIENIFNEFINYITGGINEL